MFACSDHVYGFGVSVSEPSALGRKGPNSEKRPPEREEQPGPPFVCGSGAETSTVWCAAAVQGEAW